MSGSRDLRGPICWIGVELLYRWSRSGPEAAQRASDDMDAVPLWKDVGAQSRRGGMSEPLEARDRPLRVAATALLVALAYYAGANIGLILRFPPLTPSVLWPPNAILTAALLLAPVRRWWVYLAAALPAHLIAEAGWPLPMVLALFATNCSEALIAAACVRRWSDAPTTSRHPSARARLRRGRRHLRTVRLVVPRRRGRDCGPARAVLARVARPLLLQCPHRADGRARHRRGRDLGLALDPTRVAPAENRGGPARRRPRDGRGRASSRDPRIIRARYRGCRTRRSLCSCRSSSGRPCASGQQGSAPRCSSRRWS